MPELEGSLILQKSFEDMEYYLDNGNFPSEDSDNEPVRRRGAEAPARRAAAPARRIPASEAGVTRRGAQPAQEAHDEEPAPRSRASRRGGNGSEVF